MQVILLKDVRNVGRKDEVRNVADGYASNYLFPHNLAVVASASQIALLEKKRAEITAEKTKEEDALDENVRALQGARIELTVRATPKGGLFKSIGQRELSLAIQEHDNVVLPVQMILLESPIKTTGDHIVPIRSKNARSDILFVIKPAE